MRRLLTALGVAAAACGLGGCGEDFGEPVTVTGTFTCGSEPVADADVTFHSQRTELPAAERARTGKTDAQGAFSIPGVLPGDYDVWIVKTQLNPEMAPAEAVPVSDPLAKFGPGSPLKAAVGEQTEFVFELNDF